MNAFFLSGALVVFVLESEARVYWLIQRLVSSVVFLEHHKGVYISPDDFQMLETFCWAVCAYSSLIESSAHRTWLK